MDQRELLVLLVRDRLHAYGMRIARKFRGLVERDDVISAVDLALMRASHRFEPERGPFIVFAMIWVRRELMHLLRRASRWNRWEVSDPGALEIVNNDDCPHSDAERREIDRLIDAQHELWRAHIASELSVRQLSARTGLDRRLIERRIRASDRRLKRLLRDKDPARISGRR